MASRSNSVTGTRELSIANRYASCAMTHARRSSFALAPYLAAASTSAMARGFAFGCAFAIGDIRMLSIAFTSLAVVCCDCRLQ